MQDIKVQSEKIKQNNRLMRENRDYIEEIKTNMEEWGKTVTTKQETEELWAYARSND